MNIKEFFDSPAVSLPKNRTDDDVQRYLTAVADEKQNIQAVLRTHTQHP